LHLASFKEIMLYFGCIMHSQRRNEKIALINQQCITHMHYALCILHPASWVMHDAQKDYVLLKLQWFIWDARKGPKRRKEKGKIHGALGTPSH
jgi:hypothetical protein